MRNRFSVIAVILVLGSSLASTVQAAPAQPTKLSGTFAVAYEGYDAVPLIVGLNDSSGLFGKDPVYIAPRPQQILGTFQGTASNGSYELTLPNKPQGRPFDIGGGSTPNANLMIFDVRLQSDVASRKYMAPNEDFIASSLKVSVDYQVEGGRLLVWTADDKEPFPSDRGADQKLFTADDPHMTLAAGWSLIDLDQQPFQVSRDAELTVDLITTGIGDSVDYSSLSCAELIPTFLDRVQKNYPFTQLHKIDWTALRNKLIPASKAAKTTADCQRIIRDFGNAIPDGHVDFQLPALQDDYAGGLGIRLDATSDGKIVVVLVRSGSPADQAGIKRGAIITNWDGKPVQEAINDVVLQYANSSTPHGLLGVKLSLLPFGKMGSKVQVTYQNPEEPAATATLTRVQPQRSQGAGTDDPQVKDNKLPSGVGYIRIPSFLSAETLTNFDKAVDGLIKDNVPGIIIDVRSNPGGLSQLSDAMASRFFDKGFVVGSQYTPDGRLAYLMQVDPRPPIYHGPVVVLVDRNTASTGDIFAYTFKSSKRATVVGHTPSSGMAGTVSGGQYQLPDGAFIQVPTGGFTDEAGNLAVEGVGVVPDIVVPVTVESLLSTKDDVLEAAVASFQLEPAR